MSKTMKAAVVRGFREPLLIEEVPVPTPRRGEVLIRLSASGKVDGRVVLRLG